ncbi:hypothetical protein AQUCO_02100004v1 [Aquilegia coerulea]|uniref:NADH dehydrogenase [ubiquinone] 1 alpha subcomplex subunit 12 n=1 Tax=Aquilegia coerulea TaxID=218851 RepID=A0A2G5DF84_AQUCA|nr:hypothetical protein AQUCO_02100004v1 [Aquilegia coerulea]PIA41877.1 hypothetical protein AQUCO_02100004v1 [Aquilegia coerulea]
MSKLLSRLAGFFSSRSFVGADKAGNRYFTRKEDMDGIVKEKRWVIFKGEEDPTSVPVEWICWLNGQRKKAPTPEEMAELEARRERVKLNVALLKREEEEKMKAKQGNTRQRTSTGTVGGPDLKSFIRQYPPASVKGDGHAQETSTIDDHTDKYRMSKDIEEKKSASDKTKQQPESLEPTGSGASFKPGTWQPPV